MDSTWIYNFDCNHPQTNTSKYFDDKIIPEIFYNEVLLRNKNRIYDVIKYNPKLSKDILKFFYHNLANSFNFKKSGKFGAPTKIGWKLNDSENIIMNFTDQYQFYQYIVSRHWNQTNFGFLVQVIKKYLDELNYGLYLINNKHCGAKYYYRLGINVTNDNQYRKFIANFV